MRTLIRGAQFRRDVKLAQRRGKDLSKLRDLILLLVEGQPLPARYKDHPLSGDWKHYRDCHIESDWLLIYRIEGDTICTWFVPERTRIVLASRGFEAACAARRKHRDPSTRVSRADETAREPSLAQDDNDVFLI